MSVEKGAVIGDCLFDKLFFHADVRLAQFMAFPAHRPGSVPADPGCAYDDAQRRESASRDTLARMSGTKRPKFKAPRQSVWLQIFPNITMDWGLKSENSTERVV